MLFNIGLIAQSDCDIDVNQKANKIYKKGVKLLDAHDMDNALGCFYAAIKLDEDFPEALYSISRIRLFQTNSKKN